MSGFAVRAVTPEDREQWCALYAGYRAFYRLEPDDDVVHTAWEWVLDREHSLFGLVAASEDQLLGLANGRWFARPSAGGMGLYLDDLFTATEARGRGVASALLDELAVVAASENASVVRWVTAEDNSAARSVYDVHAKATQWVTYDMQPLEIH